MVSGFTRSLGDHGEGPFCGLEEFSGKLSHGAVFRGEELLTLVKDIVGEQFSVK